MFNFSAALSLCLMNLEPIVIRVNINNKSSRDCVWRISGLMVKCPLAMRTLPVAEKIITGVKIIITSRSKVNQNFDFKL